MPRESWPGFLPVSVGSLLLVVTSKGSRAQSARATACCTRGACPPSFRGGQQPSYQKIDGVQGVWGERAQIFTSPLASLSPTSRFPQQFSPAESLCSVQCARGQAVHLWEVSFLTSAFCTTVGTAGFRDGESLKASWMMINPSLCLLSTRKPVICPDVPKNAVPSLVLFF